MELKLTAPDPDSPVPLYHQVETDLRRLIRAGELPPGGVVPPEQELSRGYGVSRHTMREALSRLVRDDLITRTAGRGTFVQPPPDRATFYLNRSFTRQMAEMGREAHSQVLECSRGTIGETAPEPLHEHRGASYLRLLRLRFGDHEPIGLQHATVAAERCPGLEAYDFTRRSLYDVLAREYGLSITKIRHTVGAQSAGKKHAALLDVAAGDPLLLVRTTALLDTGEVIEHTTSRYRADRYEYRTAHVWGKGK